MMSSQDFESKIQGLDISLFDPIPSESSAGDKTSWLALQRHARAKGRYVYLEIGSHLGGSIQQHLIDPRCEWIYSIDKRPVVQPDDRGEDYRYEGNSTERMLENLRGLDRRRMDKLTCFDLDAAEVDRSRIDQAPDLCFIDGQHTMGAVLSDFEFCRKVCDNNSIIYFHDVYIIWPAIAAIVRNLERERITFRPLKLGGSTFALALGESPFLEDDRGRSLAADGRRFLMLRRMRSAIVPFIPAPLLPPARWIAARALGSEPSS